MKRVVPIIAITLLAGNLGAFGAEGSRGAAGAKQLTEAAIVVVHQADGHPQLAELGRRAKGLFVIPKVEKGGMKPGAEGGRGLLLAKQNGTWSEPVFLDLGSITVAPGAAGEVGPVILYLMTDRAMESLGQGQDVTLDDKAGLRLVAYTPENANAIAGSDILVWSMQSGVFSTASITARDIKPDDRADRSFYGHPVKPAEILSGQVHSKAADALISALP